MLTKVCCFVKTSVYGRQSAVWSIKPTYERFQMSNLDEPIFDNGDGVNGSEAPDQALRAQIEYLANRQPYGVLCLQGEGQPYGALVAVAFSSELKHAVFATPVSTRKHRLLSECDRVALVLDNRPEKVDDLMQVEAITATGRAQMVERGAEFQRWSELLVKRHPHLQPFVHSPTCAVYRIDVVRYFHVVRFQEVRQWIPTENS